MPRTIPRSVCKLVSVFSLYDSSICNLVYVLISPPATIPGASRNDLDSSAARVRNLSKPPWLRVFELKKGEKKRENVCFEGRERSVRPLDVTPWCVFYF